METVVRRLDLLKMEGEGFNKREIVKHLSEKHQVSDRCIYYDFETRNRWQPSLLQLKDAEQIFLRVTNRYDQIYRHAGFKFLQASNDSIQLGALKIMLEANNKIYDLLAVPEILNRVQSLEDEIHRRRRAAT